jgi:hypothetical protein
MTAPSQGGFARWSAEPPAEPDDDFMSSFLTESDESDDAAPPAAGEVGSHAAPSQSFWARFRAWRRTRPFWGALFAFVGGGEILLTMLAPLPIIIHFGTLTLLGFAVPILMMLCALMLWIAPHPRLFYASLILLLSLTSWILSNLGGFILGMVLGILGGALALTWTSEPRSRRA